MTLDLSLESSSSTPSPKVFSVSEISLALKKHVESHFSDIYVRGEIAGLKIHTSGHAYYTLKDQDSVIDAICWKGTLSSKGLKLEEGLEIIAKGRLTTFPGRSKYQIIVEHFKPAGQGALLQLLQKRKEKLQAEGLFSLDKKKPLPHFPKTIGLITSATGAVIQDILHRLQDRYPCTVLLWPVAVQGEGASQQVCEAIEGFNALLKENQPDILIVARGGGSLEDLMAFNEENVVRAAFNSIIPIISAVGHETDTTLIDYASDLRAPTPTAAAEFATPVRQELLAYLTERSKHLTRLMEQDLIQKKLSLKSLEKGLPHPKKLLDDLRLKVEDKAQTLHNLMHFYQERLGHKLSHLSLRLRFPFEWLQTQSKKLSILETSLQKNEADFFNNHLHQLSLLSHRLESASYEKTLKRGFSLTKISNKLIKSKKQALTLENFDVVFYDGDIKVKPLLK